MAEVPELQYLGISRSPRYSPNSTQRDAAIFQAVAEGLRHRGCKVETVCEDQLTCLPPHCSHVFSMARNPSVLHLLATAETQGVWVCNSAQALLRADRGALNRSFQSAGVQVPPFVMLDTRTAEVGHFPADIPVPLWLKRSEACAQEASDVCFVERREEIPGLLRDYARRGVEGVLACPHIPGDLIKFYGVAGTDFFYLHYPTAEGAFSKFGLERHNGTPSGFPLDRKRLHDMADLAARTTGIRIYGGDAIVTAEGKLFLIDFNDWPSFSRCREEAAKAILQICPAKAD